MIAAQTCIMLVRKESKVTLLSWSVLLLFVYVVAALIVPILISSYLVSVPRLANATGFAFGVSRLVIFAWLENNGAGWIVKSLASSIARG